MLFGIALLTACICDNNKGSEELNKLKIQLEATEAQLLNVSAELSKCKNENNATNTKENP